MEIWHHWLHTLAMLYAQLSGGWGLSDGATIIAITLALRLLCLPVSFKVARDAQRNQAQLRLLQPRLDMLKNQYRDEPRILLEKTMALHREHGVRMMSTWTWVNMLLQSAVGVGIYRTVTNLKPASRFLWIGSLAKPDAWLTLLVAALMAFGMSQMPGFTGGSQGTWLLLIGILVSLYMVATLPSAVGIYWAASNTVTLTQAWMLRAAGRSAQVRRGK